MPPLDSSNFGRRATDGMLIEFMGQMRECVGELKKTNQHLEQMLDEHHKTLYGNGKDGLKTEVDRLKQTEKARKWYWRVAMGAIITLLIDRMRDLIHFGKG